jgi:mRNA-degrading endonuclease RelE of RelBE toxin-antitoxin system
MTWSLILANQAERTIKRAPWHDRDQIRAALRLLTDNPYNGDVKPLKGAKRRFRRRVGSWRVLYELNVERGLIMVTAIQRRGSNTY